MRRRERLTHGLSVIEPAERKQGKRSAGTASAADLGEPLMKDIAMRIVSSAENSSTDRRAQFGYITAAKDPVFKAAHALAKAKPPSQGGDETTWLNAFMDARVWTTKQEPAHENTSRVGTAQRVWLKAGNLDLNTPLRWKVHGQSFEIR